MWLKSFKTICFASLLTSQLYAKCGYNGDWDLWVGYRRDDFDWQISGPLGYPNLEAELNWQDINILEAGSRVVLSGWDHIYLRVEFNYGTIQQLKSIYSVFGGNDRTDLLAQSHNCHSSDWVFDATGAIGYHFATYREFFDFAPVVGYSLNAQNLTFNRPTQNYSVINPANIGQTPDLRALYKARWSGIFAGFDWSFKITPCFSIGGEVEGHYARYRAKGSWDWRTVFTENWEDCSNGWGKVLRLGAYYTAGDGWSFGVSGGYESYRARPGMHNVTRLIDLSSPSQQFLGTLPDSSAIASYATIQNPETTLDRVSWRAVDMAFTFHCEF